MARTLKRLNLYNTERRVVSGLLRDVFPPRRLDETVRNAYFSDEIQRYDDLLPVERNNLNTYARP